MTVSPLDSVLHLQLNIDTKTKVRIEGIKTFFPTNRIKQVFINNEKVQFKPKGVELFIEDSKFKNFNLDEQISVKIYINPKHLKKNKLIDKIYLHDKTQRLDSFWSKKIFFIPPKKQISKRLFYRNEDFIHIKDNFTLTIQFNQKLNKKIHIQMDNNSSLIIENSLTMTNSSAISIKGKNWNSIIFKNNKNTLLKNISIDGGRGGYANGHYYDCVLCIRKGSYIISNLRMNNSLAEDMFSIKGAQVQIENIYLENAQSDLLDSDYSTVHIKNSVFKNAQGDNLDFSHSLFSIQNSTLLLAKDKALSVGEKSKGKIRNTLIQQSNTGVAIKDGSELIIGSNNQFKSNTSDIKLYNKKPFYYKPRVIYEK